jgi:hypothetical protein
MVGDSGPIFLEEKLMNEKNARAVAGALGGEAWHSGGNIWLVRFRGKGGRLVVVSEETVCEYEDEEAFYEGNAARSIDFAAAS